MTAALRHLTSDQLSRSVDKYVEDAAGGATFIIESHGKTAGIVSMDEVRRLHKVEAMIDDMRLMSIAAVRMATDNGKRTSLAEVAELLGFDPDELRSED